MLRITVLLLTGLLLIGCGGGEGIITVPVNPDGKGDPKIVFTSIPAYGTQADLNGQVYSVDANYKVAVYIFVSGWYNKPMWEQPLTSIRDGGKWTCDVTTGEYDDHATRILAYLVPPNYTPPLMDGEHSLPSELEMTAVAKCEIIRTQP